MLTSNAVGVTFANRLWGSFAWLMSVFVALSAFGTLNGILLTSSRCAFLRVSPLTFLLLQALLRWRSRRTYANAFVLCQSVL